MTAAKTQEGTLPPADAISPLARAVSARDARTLDMVRDAIAHGETLLAYQPVVSARLPGTVAFYEGLIRVLDATGRVIPARDFMPVVEDTELGRQLDVIALRMGLTALQRHPALRLSINMSARSIGYKGWSELLQRSLDRNPTLGERLILEITETSAMTLPELVVDLMDEMQPRGVCFALDDFGAGQTAIRYFKDFLFDVIKIDGQFIRGIAQNADNRVLTAALVSIAGHFDMLTIAENVETAQDAAAVAALGVDCMQGYHFGAPTLKPAWLASARRGAVG
ncbi:diguanylate phosphodiesterase [Sulfitobacter alexandrii]|uniref:Diguanylate phosphodiesterase n=1 Tax=Sulfitobacter alexandrii TaxID=1917485 RepID=A0A1J0WEA3_9RHOB|nr:EAL domain-containing protein [Sulfitobacter alexandrii]APE42647.1 diguanylate phosphodiesterase [Sulfitobacter alexandrii]